MNSESKQVAQRWQFSSGKKWLVLVLSLAMIIPCFWHRHIEAGDLGSHVYNAWLAQLIEKGQAPGLYVVRQWNNVLFDWLLLHTANIAGFALAEKVVVSLCVLIFFWGVFSLIAAASGQPPWFLAPAIAMLAYGYSFNMGFLNYYLSLGLASASLALAWRGREPRRFLGLLLVPLVLLAHPIGFLWLAGAALFIALWTKLPAWWKLVLPAAAVIFLFATRSYLMHQTRFPVDWAHDPFYLMTGADQLTLYGERYVFLGWAAFAFAVVCVVADVISRKRDSSFWQSVCLPASLYFVAVVA